MKDTSVLKIIAKVIAVLAIVAGIVFAIYHWELDKKFVAWIKNCRQKCCCAKNEEPEEAVEEEAPAQTLPEEPKGIVPECTMDDVVILSE